MDLGVSLFIALAFVGLLCFLFGMAYNKQVYALTGFFMVLSALIGGNLRVQAEQKGEREALAIERPLFIQGQDPEIHVLTITSGVHKISNNISVFAVKDENGKQRLVISGSNSQCTASPLSKGTKVKVRQQWFRSFGSPDWLVADDKESVGDSPRAALLVHEFE